MMTMSRPQLVLDVSGVLITNLTPAWQEIAHQAGMTLGSLSEVFKKEVREPLWKGEMSESEFWIWLTSYCPTLDTTYARRLIDIHMTPLPAFEQLVHWSQIADIHLLSNHRKEWIDVILKPIKPYIKSITISSEVGLCKPDPSIYTLVSSQFNSDSPLIIYVDDQTKNLKPAHNLGWIIFIADDNGSWIDRLTKIFDLIDKKRRL